MQAAGSKDLNVLSVQVGAARGSAGGSAACAVSAHLGLPGMHAGQRPSSRSVRSLRLLASCSVCRCGLQGACFFVQDVATMSLDLGVVCQLGSMWLLESAGATRELELSPCEDLGQWASAFASCTSSVVAALLHGLSQRLQPSCNRRPAHD